MLLLAVLFVAAAPLARGWRNGAALTPPMGFANWNLFGCNYDDAFFRQIADAFVTTGLRDAGYEYMLVQECIVPKGARDPVTHVVIPDAAKFPHGLADLAAYFHSKGLKAGIYTDVAHLTCADYEGSGPGGDHGPAPGYISRDANRGRHGGDGPHGRAIPVQLGRRAAVGVGARGREPLPQHGRHLRAGQHLLRLHP